MCIVPNNTTILRNLQNVLLLSQLHSASDNARAHAFCRSTIRSRDTTNGRKLLRSAIVLRVDRIGACDRSATFPDSCGRDALPTARQSASIGHDELQPVDPMRLLLSLLASLTFLSALAPSAPAQQGETLRIGIARRSGHPRSDLLAHLCRNRRDDGAVRQAVRLRCEAEHRAGAGHRLRMGGRQDVADQAAHRGAVPQRGKIRRRCGEILVGTPPQRQRQLPPQRDRCDGPCRGGRSADRAGGDEAGVLAVRRHPDRSRRHDAAAEGSRGRRQGFRPASGVRGAVPVRRAGGAGPHHAGALPRLLGRAAHPL